MDTPLNSGVLTQQIVNNADMTFSTFMQKLEVKPTEDEYESIETSRWGNRDVYPIPHDKRTYGVYAFVSYCGKSLEFRRMINGY